MPNQYYITQIYVDGKRYENWYDDYASAWRVHTAGCNNPAIARSCLDLYDTTSDPFAPKWKTVADVIKEKRL